MASLSLKDIVIGAYQHTRNHKFLWFFGFFLAGGGVMNFTNNLDIDLQDMVEKSNFLFSTFQNNPARSVALLFGALLIIGILLFLGAISRAALIYSGLHLERKEEITFIGVLKNVRKHFFAVFRLSMFTTVVILFVLLAIFAPLAYFYRHGIGENGVLLYGLGAALFSPIVITLSLVNIFGACFVVVYDLKYDAALKSAFDLFFRFWEDSISLLVALFTVYVLLFFCSAGVIGLAGALAYMLSILLKSLSVPFVLGAVGFISTFLIVAMLVLNAIINVFTNLAWTLFFLRFVKAKELPKEEAAFIKPAI